jgi:hypothetical protein
MYYKHFVGKLNMPGFDELTWHYYESENFNSAEKTLNIYINLGLGNTKINRTD